MSEREGQPSANQGSDPVDTVARRIDERLSHLFRASLKDGRIHPLYVPMLQYRHARQEQ